MRTVIHHLCRGFSYYRRWSVKTTLLYCTVCTIVQFAQVYWDIIVCFVYDLWYYVIVILFYVRPFGFSPEIHLCHHWLLKYCRLIIKEKIMYKLFSVWTTELSCGFITFYDDSHLRSRTCCYSCPEANLFSLILCTIRPEPEFIVQKHALTGT